MMHTLAFFGMPGPLEMIILGLMCLGVLAVVVVLVVVLTTQRTAANPDLYPCPECGRPVSVHAKSCPQCGYPLHAESRGDGTESEE